MTEQTLFKGLTTQEWREVLAEDTLESLLGHDAKLLPEESFERLNGLAADMYVYAAELFRRSSDEELPEELSQLRNSLATDSARQMARLFRQEAQWSGPVSFRRKLLGRIKLAAPHYLNRDAEKQKRSQPEGEGQ